MQYIVLKKVNILLKKAMSGQVICLKSTGYSGV